MLILDENWTGERLCIKLAVLTNSRNRRLISIALVPKGPGIESWRSCRFLGSMFRALNDLPGGLGRFIPCKLVGNHCRLRHIGWEHSGHGLTSGSREKADPCVLGPLLLLFVFFHLGLTLNLGTAESHLLGSSPHGLSQQKVLIPCISVISQLNRLVWCVLFGWRSWRPSWRCRSWRSLTCCRLWRRWRFAGSRVCWRSWRQLENWCE